MEPTEQTRGLGRVWAFAISLILLFSGLALMRVEGFEIKNPDLRSVMYWAHVITPFLAVWLYILHRLAGPKIKWKAGVSWAAAVGVVVVGMVLLHTQDPRKWNVVGPKEGVKYFEPSLARTASGNFIPADTLMMDKYCQECHPDVYKGWFHSVHHFSSFNNEPYHFSITETRNKMLERDGNVKASRWCAGCHDPVPFSVELLMIPSLTRAITRPRMPASPARSATRSRK